MFAILNPDGTLHSYRARVPAISAGLIVRLYTGPVSQLRVGVSPPAIGMNLQKNVAWKLKAMWDCAIAKETSNMTNSGPSVVLMGVQAGVPAALQLQQWVQDLYKEAYRREDLIVNATDFSQLDAVSIDFTAWPDKPATIRDVATALGLV